jgi:peptide/nickel transport system permease protein
LNGTVRGILSAFLGPRLAGRVGAMGSAATVGAQAGAKGGGKGESTSGAGFVLRFIMKDRAALCGLVIVGAFLLFGLVEGIMQQLAVTLRHPEYGWMLLPSNPLALNLRNSLAPPSLASLDSIFGYSYEGQSIFSGILYATPRDALASILVVASGILIGLFVGIPAGYVGGWTDEILMRVTDAFLAFPFLVLAIAFAVILGSGYSVVLLVLVIVWWPTYARYFRAQAIALKSRGFVEASKLSGVSSFRIMIRHIFPNAIDPVIAQATLDFGTVIVVYSTLAFLGIGLSPGVPEWGAMTSEGLPFFPNVWWWSVVPGLVITVIVIAFTLIGDRIQDLVGGRITY